MTSRIAKELLAIGRRRVGAATMAGNSAARNTAGPTPMAFSTSVTKSQATAPVGPLTALVRTWYNLFGSSTARYATFLAVGVILAEMGTNSLTDYLWESNNKGKTYKQVDWSKFDPQEEEDEDDDDDDEDDDDDDDDE